MALTAAIDLTVKKPSFGSMKAEIRALTLEAQRAVQQFGEFSPEAQRAENALAEARDRMDDFNDRVAAVNPDKFAQIQTVVQGVARGFQAAQGAVALFGAQSEDLEKTMVKLQGAMALAEGLEGLGKIQQQFGAIAGNIKGNVVKAFQALGRISTMAFGIIGIALTLIIANFETLKNAVMSLIPGLKTFADFVGNLVQKFTDFVGITSASERALEKLNKQTEKNNQQIEREIALLSAKGDEIGVFNKKRQLLENELAQARANYGKNTEKEWGKIILDTKNSLAVLAVEEQKYNKQKAEDTRQANIDAKKERDAERAKQVQDELERQKALEDARKKGQDQIISAELDYNESQRQIRIEQAQFEEDKIQEQYNAKMEQLKEAQIQEQIANVGNEEALLLIQKKYDNLTLLAGIESDKALADLQAKRVDEAEKLRKEEADKIAEERKKEAEDIIKTDTQISDARLQIAKSTVDGLTALNDILTKEDKKRENIQKGIALVEIAIDSAMAFSSLNAESAQASAKVAGILGPATPIYTAAYYAQGVARILANVAKAKQVLNGGGGGQGQTSASPIAINPPSLTSSALPTEAGAGFPTRVFVTEGDISRTQQRVGNTKRVSVVR